MGERGVAVGGDDDTLAGGEAVVFDDVGRPELVERVGGLLGGRAESGLGGWYVGRRHDFFCERLAAFELRGRLRRAETDDALCLDRVDNTCHQGVFRPDDHEVGSQFDGQVGNRVVVAQVDGSYVGDGGDAGVAGCADELINRRVIA